MVSGPVVSPGPPTPTTPLTCVPPLPDLCKRVQHVAAALQLQNNKSTMAIRLDAVEACKCPTCSRGPASALRQKSKEHMEIRYPLGWSGSHASVSSTCPRSCRARCDRTRSRWRSRPLLLNHSAGTRVADNSSRQEPDSTARMPRLTNQALHMEAPAPGWPFGRWSRSPPSQSSSQSAPRPRAAP